MGHSYWVSSCSILGWLVTIQIAGLRVEVFRARALVSGFNQVLETCERSNFWLRTANQGAIIILLIFFVAGVSWWVAIRLNLGRKKEGKSAFKPALTQVSEVTAPAVDLAGLLMVFGSRRSGLRHG